MTATRHDIDARDDAEIAAALGGAIPHTGRVDDARDIDEYPRARDLLAHIATRARHAPTPAHLERAERRFVRWLLVTLAALCALTLAALWWLDPISVTGRQTRFSVVENGGVRQAKLDLMERLKQPPQVLVLGSSRSMKLDPADIQQLTGATAFNGSVSGGTTQDMYLYARYANELWGDAPGTATGRSNAFPHLVIGIVPDVFRVAGTSVLDPRLKHFVPKRDASRNPLDTSSELFQITTLKAGYRAVRRIVARDGVASLLHPTTGVGRADAALATTGRQKGNQLENLSPRGMQLFNPQGADDSIPLKKRVDTYMRTYVRNSYTNDPNFHGTDPRGIDFLRRTIRLANDHGDVPVVWYTPYQPMAVALMPHDRYDERNRALTRAIDTLRREGLRFTWLPQTQQLASFGGDPQQFHDAIHMTPINTRRLLAFFDRLGLLSGPKTVLRD